MALDSIKTALNTDIGITNVFDECMKSDNVDQVKVKFINKEWTVDNKKVDDPHSTFNKAKTWIANTWVSFRCATSKTYEAKYNAVLIKLDNAQKESTGLTTSAQDLIKKLDQLKGVLNREDVQITQLQSKIQDVKNELSGLIQQRDQVDKSSKGIISTKHALIGELDEYLKSVKDYNEKKNGLEEAIAKRKTTLKAKIGMKDPELQRLTDALARLDREHPAVLKLPASKGSVDSRMEAHVQQLRSNIDHQTRMITQDNPRQKLVEFGEKIDQLQKELDASQGELQKLEKEEDDTFQSADKSLGDLQNINMQQPLEGASLQQKGTLEQDIEAAHKKHTGHVAGEVPKGPPVSQPLLPRAAPEQQVPVEAQAKPQESAAAAAIAAPELSAKDKAFLDALAQISTPQMKEVWEGFLKNCVSQRGEVIDSFELKGDTLKLNLKSQIKMYVLSINEKTGKPDPKELPEGGTVLIYGDKSGKMEFKKAKDGKVDIKGFTINTHLPKIEDIPKNMRAIVKGLLFIGFLKDWVTATVVNIQATPTNFNMVITAGGSTPPPKEGALDNTKKAWSTHSNEGGLVTGNILPDDQDPTEYLKTKRQEYIQKNQIDSKK